MTVSNSTNEEFKSHCIALGNSEAVGNIDLVVRVLTTGFWPTSTLPECNMPSSAHLAFECFSR